MEQNGKCRICREMRDMRNDGIIGNAGYGRGNAKNAMRRNCGCAVDMMRMEFVR